MASKPIYVDLDFKGNQIKNVALEGLSSDPTTGVTGQLYYNTTDQEIRIYNGEEWIPVGGGDAVLTQDLTVTGVTVGNVTTGDSYVVGTPLENVLREILMKELGVTATKPTLSLSVTGRSTPSEVGSEATLVITPTFNDGKYTGESGYTYTLDAGCSATSYSYSLNDVPTELEASTFDNVRTYKLKYGFGKNTITGRVDYSAATNIPVTNFGEEITTGLIGASYATASSSVDGQYYLFVGWSTLDSLSSSNDVRGLSETEWVTTTSTSYSTMYTPTAKQNLYIAVPPGHELVSVQDTFGVVHTVGNFFVEESYTISVRVPGTTNDLTYKIYKKAIESEGTDEPTVFKNLVISTTNE